MPTEDELLRSAAAEEKWQSIIQMVCRVMMLYGYPPCMMCSFLEYCAVCSAYQRARQIVKDPDAG